MKINKTSLFNFTATKRKQKQSYVGACDKNLRFANKCNKRVGEMFFCFLPTFSNKKLIPRKN